MGRTQPSGHCFVFVFVFVFVLCEQRQELSCVRSRAGAAVPALILHSASPGASGPQVDAQRICCGDRTPEQLGLALQGRSIPGSAPRGFAQVAKR